MRRILGLFVLAGVPVIAAAQDDPLVGSIVFARAEDVELRTEDGTRIARWGASPARVVKVAPSGRVRTEALYPPGTGGAWTRRVDVVKLADAVAHFSAHVRAHPADPWGYEMRAAAYYELREGRKSIDDMTEAIRLGPTASRHALRGSQWVSLGDDARAAADFTAAVRLDPANYYALTERGRTYTRTKQFAKAEADFAEAVKLRPDDPVAFNYRGLMWEFRDEYDKAIADHSHSIQLHAGYAEAFANRANAHAGKRDAPAALADYTRAIELAPANAYYRYARGYVHAGMRDSEKALPDLTEAIRLNPADARPYLSRGHIHRQRKDTDKAVSDFTAVIRLAPKAADGFNGRGSTWDTARVYDKAVADYAEAIRLNPKLESAYNALAWLLATCPDAKHRDGAKAVELATKLVDLSAGKVADHLDTLAAAHAEAGDFDKAVEAQKRALALPGTADAVTRDYRERLKLYEAGRPYRQPAPAKKD